MTSQTHKDKRKGLTKAPQAKTVFDDSCIANCKPRDILWCRVEINYRDTGYVTHMIIHRGDKIAGRIRIKYGKKVDPVSVTITDFKVVGQRNML